MAKTTVLIDINVGPQLPPDTAWLQWAAPQEFDSGTTLVLAVAASVKLVEGKGEVQVDPGIWIVTTVGMGTISTRAWTVPESAAPVQFNSLVEVTDLSTIQGWGPTWAARAELAALQAAASAVQADLALASARDELDAALAALSQLKPMTVFYFTDPEVERPDTPFALFWIGPSMPVNKGGGDVVILTATSPIEPEINWLHYWDAASLTALADGDPVTTVVDQGSGALNLTAPAGQEPTYRAPAGSLPALIHFTRTSSTVGDALVSPAVVDNQELVYVAVVRTTTLVTSSSNTERRRVVGGIDATYNLAIDQIGGGEVPTSQPRYRLSNVGQVQVHTAAVATPAFTLLIAHWKGNETWLRVNGFEQSSAPGITSSNRTGGYTLGAGVGATGNFWDGDIPIFGVIAGLPANLLDFEAYMLDRISSWA